MSILRRFRRYPVTAVSLFMVCAIGLGTVACTAAVPADGIRVVADVNRDGAVDDPAPRMNRGVAASAGEALVLPNIGVSDARCPSSQSTASDNQLAACHDAADNIAHAPENLAAVRVLPLAGVSDQARGTLTVEGDPLGRIRVFRKAGDGWTYLRSGSMLTAQTLRSGVELGVDSRDIVRDRAGWDGRFSIRVALSDGDISSTDTVPMRVAPLVLHSHTERVTSLFVPRSDDRADHQKFVRDLREAAAGTDVSLTTLSTTDNWAQDFVEFGYASMPGPGGTVRTIEIAVRSPQPTRVAGRAIFDLRGPGFGAVQIGGRDYHLINSFGNVEVIPPYENAGRSFPAGRIIYGNGGEGAEFDRDALTLFASQDIQEPLALDTSWLRVAHVDEFVQFLPSDNARGWTIGIADPRAGVELLRATQAAAHGAVRADSHPAASTMTVDQLLADRNFLAANAEAAQAIDRNLKLLLDETGVSPDEVVRVPQLFGKDDDGLGSFGEPSARQDAGTNVHAADRPFDPATAQDGPMGFARGSFIAHVPGAVNGIVLDRWRYLAPRQWGPVVNGRDIFQDAIERTYRTVGMEIRRIDDYMTHHAMGGEVHCGTNAVRAVTRAWWKSGA